jgi:hypothetical protein
MDLRTTLRYLNHFGAKPVRQYEYRTQPDGTRQRFDLDLIEGVTLPLSAEDWCSLCMSEGDCYLGGCCANLSEVQDFLNGVFRDGGYTKLSKLKDIIEILVEHGDIEHEDYSFSLEPTEEMAEHAKEAWTDLLPLAKLAVVWALVRPFMTSSVPTARTEDIDPKEALHVLYYGIRHLSSHLMVNQVMGSDEPDASQSLAMFRLWPHLKALYERFHELNPGPLEGWVLVDPTIGPEALATNEIGTSFYTDVEDIAGLVKEWQRLSDEHKDEYGADARNKFQTLAFRNARVSVENGLEFLPGEARPIASLV